MLVPAGSAAPLTVLVTSFPASASSSFFILEVACASWLVYLDRNILEFFAHVHLKECGGKLNRRYIIVVHLVSDNLGHLGQILLVSDLHNLRENLLCLHCRNICSGRNRARLNLGMTHVLNLSYLIYLSAHNQREGASCLTRPSRSADSVHIIFDILRHIIVEYRLDIININSSCSNIRCNKNLNRSVSEAVHNLVTLEL